MIQKFRNTETQKITQNCEKYSTRENRESAKTKKGT